MSTYTIRLGHTKPPMTSNGQRRSHWADVRSAKRDVEYDVYWSVRHARIRVYPPLEVFVTWFAPDRRIRDSDACAPFLKAALDALVRVNIGLPGDDHRYVTRSGSSVVVDRADPRIEITITETEVA